MALLTLGSRKSLVVYLLNLNHVYCFQLFAFCQKTFPFISKMSDDEIEVNTFKRSRVTAVVESESEEEAVMQTSTKKKRRMNRNYRSHEDDMLLEENRLQEEIVGYYGMFSCIGLSVQK